MGTPPVRGMPASAGDCLVAYDEQLAERLREVLHAETGVTEKRMFGGLAFLVHGYLAVSASSQGGLLLRVDPANGESLLAEPHVHPFQMRGREMTGWLRVDAAALGSDEELRRWVDRGITSARSLPPK